MKKYGNDEPSLDLLVAAYLTEEGTTQAKIAATLKTSQSAVSRYLTEARERGILVDVSPQFSEHLFPKERLSEIKRRLSDDKLGEALAKEAGFDDFLVRVYRIRDDLDETSETAEKRERRFQKFGEEVAGHIRRIVGRSQVLGVSWGSHLYSALDNYGATAETERSKNLTIVPLAGEPVQQSPNRFSSTSLAAKLSALTQTKRKSNSVEDEKGSLSLAAVPAFIVPLELDAKELIGIWKYIEEVGSYSDIFGRREQDSKSASFKVNKLDTILTGIGSRPLGYGIGGMIPDSHLKKLNLNTLALGDIAGVLIPKGKKTETDLQPLTERWTGLRMEHLRSCVARANRCPHVGSGVVVLATGKERAKLLLKCVQMQLVNQLLCDEELSIELKKLLNISDSIV